MAPRARTVNLITCVLVVAALSLAEGIVVPLLLAGFLAFLLALLLRRTGVLHSFTRIVLILPFAMSPALIGVSYRFMFNSEFGVLARFFGGIFPALADRA